MRPCRINRTCRGYFSSSGISSSNTSCARWFDADSGTSPNRFDTRSTWVSTAIVGFPKWKLRTTLAVFGPIPLISVSHDFASLVGSASRNANE